MPDYLVTRVEVNNVLDDLCNTLDDYEDGDAEWNDVGEVCAATEALVERLMKQLERERTLSRAQQDLLREHYGYHLGIPGKVTPCENPQKYGVDCGVCMRCMSITTEGALKLPTSPRGTMSKCERLGIHVNGGCELHA